MSIRTTVFENGRWVTREMDPYHLRAQNADDSPNEPPGFPELSSAGAPSLGLLTKTLSRSSVVKWVVPARIRHKNKNDVLFISTDAVIIKEALGNNSLVDVAVMNDFDSPIKSARVFGRPRQLTDPDKYVQMHDWEVGRAPKTDDEKLPNAFPLHGHELPPHIAVLALGSNKLVFLFAVSGLSDFPSFICSQKELPASTSSLDQLGEHIAVDPKSRAMAVAAHEGRAYLYLLKTMEDLEKELETSSDIEPVKEELLLPIEGVILKVEFLHPPRNEPGLIILVLIVAKDKRSRLIWFEWSDNTTLRQSQNPPKVATLPREEQLPLLLVPLTILTAFMLVCEKRIVIYRDILTGTPCRSLHHLSAVQPPEEPGSSRNSPIWAHWARPMRSERGEDDSKVHDRDRYTQDAIYLCREDGIIQYVTFDINIAHLMDSTHPAGRLGTNINSAFAILDLGPSTEDLLVTAGDMSDGGLWIFRARKIAEYQAGIPNWTPLNDSVLASIPTTEQKEMGKLANTPDEMQIQLRMFAPSGRGKHGAISEFRFGTPALLKCPHTVEVGDELKGGVSGIWVFHGCFSGIFPESLDEDVTYILVSYPMRTSLLQLRRSTPKEEETTVHEPVFLVHEMGFDFSVRTLAAGTNHKGQILQITESSFRITSLPLPPVERSHSQRDYDYDFRKCRILTACIKSFPENAVVLFATQQDEFYHIRLGLFNVRFKPLGKPLVFSSRPSCVWLEKTEENVFAFVATLDKRIQVFLVDEHSFHLSLASEYSFPGSFGICDSIAVLTPVGKDGTRSALLIVCGLRDGSIETLYLSERKSSCQLDLYEHLDLGYTSMKVTTDINRSSRAILHCDGILYTLEYLQESAHKPLATVSRIWVTDLHQKSLQQGSIAAISQAGDTWSDRDMPGLVAGLLIYVEGDSLHFAEIDRNPKPQMVPRRMHIEGTPTRVLYSSRLDKLIVINNKVTIRNTRRAGGYNKYPGRREIEPRIMFLDPGKLSNENEDLMVPERNFGERFLNITEWLPKVDGDEYHLLVVATRYIRAFEPAGRLLFISIKTENGHFKMISKKTIQHEAPVYCVAPLSSNSLVYCCGSDLWIQTLAKADSSGLTWRAAMKASMRSPARHLTVDEPYIYVSSARESFSIFRFEHDGIIYQFGDHCARDGLYHINVPSHSLVLASNMNNSVVGLWYPPRRGIDNAMTTVFEAVLPASVTRLHHAHHNGDDTIIGTSADGAIIQMEILDEKQWRLLRFIQNMAERNPIVCPFIGSGPHRRHIEPSTAKPHYKHVNGDILQRVTERGGAKLLRDMLDQDPDPENTHTDFDGREERWRRFVVIVTEALFENFEDDSVVESMKLLEQVEEWLRFRLRRALASR